MAINDTSSEAIDFFDEIKNLSIDDVIKKVQKCAFEYKDENKLSYLLKLIGLHSEYNLGSLILLSKQRPDFTIVGGYSSWKGYKRHVRRGEKGIVILKPTLNKNDNSLMYETVPVFDISQTDLNNKFETYNPPNNDKSDDVKTPQTLINYLRSKTACEVETVQDDSTDDVSYDNEKNILYLATEDKNRIASFCLQLIVKNYVENSCYTDYMNGEIKKNLFIDCISIALAARYKIKYNVSLSYLNIDTNAFNIEEFYSFLTYVRLAVYEMSCNIEHDDFKLSFDMIAIINTCINSTNRLQAIDDIDEIMNNTSSPELSDIANDFENFLCDMEDDDFRRLYNDRISYRVLANPLYKIPISINEQNNEY